MRNDLAFPILHLQWKQKVVGYSASLDELSTCSSPALRAGYYNELEIIDSDLREHKIVKAWKLHGVGKFWGYDIFLDQRIRVGIEFYPQVQDLTLDQIKTKLLKIYSNRNLEPDERKRIKNAVALPEIMELFKPMLVFDPKK